MWNQHLFNRAPKGALARRLPPERLPETFFPMEQPEWAEPYKFYRYVLGVGEPR